MVGLLAHILRIEKIPGGIVSPIVVVRTGSVGCIAPVRTMAGTITPGGWKQGTPNRLIPL